MILLGEEIGARQWERLDDLWTRRDRCCVVCVSVGGGGGEEYSGVWGGAVGSGDCGVRMKTAEWEGGTETFGIKPFQTRAIFLSQL